jgi:diguanylate cyclase (GGDEF)-like protein
LYQKDLEDLNAKLRERADLDGLTGLHNRRAFEERLEEEISRSARHGIPLSLLMLDVDHFKALNDTLGHTAGDRVLQALSGLLRDSARPMDFVSRYGGEEFVIILPHTGVEASHLMAERLRRVVESAPWPVRQVTISLGIATLTPTITDARTLLESADRALYHSKQAGRNRVSHAADDWAEDAAGPEVAPE